MEVGGSTSVRGALFVLCVLDFSCFSKIDMVMYWNAFENMFECHKVKFLFIDISGICLGIQVFEDSHSSQSAVPQPVFLNTMTQLDTNTQCPQCSRLVHADELCIELAKSIYLDSSKDLCNM